MIRGDYITAIFRYRPFYPSVQATMQHLADREVIWCIWSEPIPLFPSNYLIDTLTVAKPFPILAEAPKEARP